MSVSIEVVQNRTLEEGPLYRVNTSVVHVMGINRNVFVFNTETQVFEHVATTWDMENLPIGRDAAVNADADYYRQDAVSVDYETETVGTEAASYTLGRLQSLATAYQIMKESFVGSDSHIYVGS